MQKILESMLSQSLQSRDSDLLLRTLEIYSLVCNVEAAEGRFREMIVAPALKEVWSGRKICGGERGVVEVQ